MRSATVGIPNGRVPPSSFGSRPRFQLRPTPQSPLEEQGPDRIREVLDYVRVPVAMIRRRNAGEVTPLAYTQMSLIMKVVSSGASPLKIVRHSKVNANSQRVVK